MNEGDLFVAEVCHIRAALPGGPRYSARQSDKERRNGSNLILLCHAHHVVVDSDVRRFSVRNLVRIKERHESQHRQGAFRPSDGVLLAVEKDIEQYWTRIAFLNRDHMRSGVPAVRLDVRRDPVALYRMALKSWRRLEDATSGVAGGASRFPDEVRAFLERIGASTREWDAVPYYENPTYNWCWEILNLGIPNWLLNIRVALLQLEILELERRSGLSGSAPRMRLTRLRHELEQAAKHGAYHD